MVSVGFKRGHGVLEYQGDLVAAQPLRAALGQREQIGAVEPYLACGDPAAVRGSRPMIARADGALAAAGFADQGEDFAGIDAERHAVERVNRAARGVIDRP